MVLIAYHLLESSIGAYIEWLVNELMMTANKIEYKDARLVILPADAITHKPNKPCISLESFIFLLLGFYSPVAGDWRILRADSYVWKPPGGLRKDSFLTTTVVFIYNSH